jgi:anthranilate synthase/aminodeoxychorismate synthase-like glutamine amidotransferase
MIMSCNRDVVLVDNFDSFSYNLAEEFSVLGTSLNVVRNTISVSKLQQLLVSKNNPLLVLSPGPGTPEQAGNCIAFIREFLGQFAMLGICLGHQAMVVACGGTVERAPQAKHGERSMLKHQNDEIFSGLPPSFLVGRYHSLVATQLPAGLQSIAEAEHLCMAIRHEKAAIGLQFHPESILTTHGRHLLRNIVTQLQVEP